jgi:hypothetical protein
VNDDSARRAVQGPYRPSPPLPRQPTVEALNHGGTERGGHMAQHRSMLTLPDHTRLETWKAAQG